MPQVEPARASSPTTQARKRRLKPSIGVRSHCAPNNLANHDHVGAQNPWGEFCAPTQFPSDRSKNALILPAIVHRLLARRRQCAHRLRHERHDFWNKKSSWCQSPKKSSLPRNDLRRRKKTPVSKIRRQPHEKERLNLNALDPKHSTLNSPTASAPARGSSQPAADAGRLRSRSSSKPRRPARCSASSACRPTGTVR